MLLLQTLSTRNVKSADGDEGCPLLRKLRNSFDDSGLQIKLAASLYTSEKLTCNLDIRHKSVY